MAKLQIKRSSAIYSTIADAKKALVDQLALAADGELLASRYYVNGSDATGGVKTVLGIKATGDNSNTIFDVDAIPSGVQAELDKIGYKITKKETANPGMVATYVLEGSKISEGNVEIDIPKAPEYSVKEVTSAEANVRTAYQLTKDGTEVGAVIKIPKDSALLGVALTQGAADNLPTFNAETKTFTAPETGTLHDVLAFAYSLEDGTVQVVVIDVADFLRESEFKGTDFAVTNGEVSLKEDRIKEIVLGASMPAANVTVADADGVFTGENVEAVLKELDDKINTISAEAIGVVAGTGIEISGDGTEKTIAVNIPETSATADSGKFLTKVTLNGTTLSKEDAEVTAGIVKVTPIEGKLEATNVQAAFAEVYQDIEAATATAGQGINVVGNVVSVKSADASISVSDAGVAVDVIDCGTF